MSEQEHSRLAAPLPVSRQARRHQIMTEARRIFAEQGYHRATMEEIAEACFVSKPVLYQHFSGKSTLYQAVVDEDLQRLGEAMRVPLPDVREIPPVVEAFVDRFTRAIVNHPVSYRLIFDADRPQGSDLERRLEGLLDDAAQEIAQRLAQRGRLTWAEGLFLGRLLLRTAMDAAPLIMAEPDAEHKRRFQQLAYTLAAAGLNQVEASAH